MSELAVQPPERLLRNSQFNLYWAGQAFSSFGNAFGTLALPLLVFDLTGSLFHMGLVSAVYGAFRLLAGVVVGPVVDRVDRKRLMIVADAARAVVFGSIPLVWLVEPQLWLIYVCAAVGATLGLTFQVAHVSMVQQLVRRSQLAQANGRLETTNSVSYLIGPIAAGALAATAGPAAAIGVDALTFVGSAVAILLLRSPAPDETDRDGDPYATRPEGWRASFTRGFAFLWGNAALRWLMILLTLFTAVTVTADDLLVFWLQDHLHVSSTTTGIVFAVAAVGALVAAISGGPLHRAYGFAICWFGGFGLVALSILALPFSRQPWMVALTALVFGFGSTLGGICSMSLRQLVTPSRILGRVTAAFWTVTTCLAPLGAAVLTKACGSLGVGPVLIPTGIALLLLLAVGLASPLGSRSVGRVEAP